MDLDREETQGPRRRMIRVVATGLGLLGLGAAAGGIASMALSANAAVTSPSTAAAPQSSSGSSSTGPSPQEGFGLTLSGTVTAVGSSDVTIKSSTGTTTYAVSSSSDIDKNGEAAISNLAVGDAVMFSTTTNGTTAIDRLHAGNAQLDMPQGGGPRGPLSLSGTVTAVGSSDVTIKSSTGTTTYAVSSSSDIDKNGEAAISNLAVGDAVTFSTTTTNGTTAIDRLHAGNAQLDMPQGGGPANEPGPGSHSNPSASSTSSA